MKPDDLPSIEKYIFGIPIDKVVHFTMFLPFPILCSMSIMMGGMKLYTRIFILTLVFIVGAGVAYGTEIIQAQTGYRAYEIKDFYADLTGMSIGAFITLTYILIITRK
jgi:VanZ family protein